MANYTGTGTQDDPYIVADWNTFLFLAGQTDVFIKWAETDRKIIDLNDVAPEGYTNSLIINSEEIDFNGWEIWNLRFHNPSENIFGRTAGGYARLKNGNFENMYCTCDRFCANLDLNKMVFEGYFEFYTDYIIYSTANIVACSFVWEISKPSSFTFIHFLLNTPMRDSYVNICSKSLDTFDFIISRESNVTGCLFDIEMPSSVKINSWSGTQTFNVYNIKSPILYSTERPRDTKFSNCLYNSDTVVTKPDTSGLIPCTTEQLADVDYLKSIGFPAEHAEEGETD